MRDFGIGEPNILLRLLVPQDLPHFPELRFIWAPAPDGSTVLVQLTQQLWEPLRDYPFFDCTPVKNSVSTRCLCQNGTNFTQASLFEAAHSSPFSVMPVIDSMSES